MRTNCTYTVDNTLEKFKKITWTQLKTSGYLSRAFPLLYLPLTTPCFDSEMYSFIAFSGSSPNSLLPSFLIEEFESMASWITGLLDRPRVRTCFVKSCICSVEQVWNNAFSMSIHLPGPSDVRLPLLMFYDVWFHKNMFGFRALASALCQWGMNLEHGRHVEFDPKPSLFFNYQSGLLDRYG